MLRCKEISTFSSITKLSVKMGEYKSELFCLGGWPGMRKVYGSCANNVRKGGVGDIYPERTGYHAFDMEMRWR